MAKEIEKKDCQLRNGGHIGRGGKRPGAGRKPDFLKRLDAEIVSEAPNSKDEQPDSN